jgi:hypothetical protein
MKLTHKIYSETMIEMIRFGNTFSTQEMMAIASEAKMEQNVDQLLEAIRSRKTGKYGIQISSSPTNPTIRFANFEMLLDMAKIYGEVIPPDIVIDASDVTKKEEIIERLRKQAEQAQQMQMAQLSQQQSNQQTPGKIQAQTQRRKLQKV